MPGDRRLGEAKLARQFGPRGETRRAWPERGERPGGAAELDRQHPRLQFGEPRGVAVEGGEPYRRLEPEGDRERVLQMGAPGHRGVAVAPGKPGKVIAHRRQ